MKVFLAESNVAVTKANNWFCCNECDVAREPMIYVSEKCDVHTVKTAQGLISMSLTGYTIVGGYISPNNIEYRFKEYLDELTRIKRELLHPVIMMGDFNSEAVELGGRKIARRVSKLETGLDEAGLVSIGFLGTTTFVGRDEGLLLI